MGVDYVEGGYKGEKKNDKDLLKSRKKDREKLVDLGMKKREGV